MWFFDWIAQMMQMLFSFFLDFGNLDFLAMIFTFILTLFGLG